MHLAWWAGEVEGQGPLERRFRVQAAVSTRAWGNFFSKCIFRGSVHHPTIFDPSDHIVSRLLSASITKNTCSNTAVVYPSEAIWYVQPAPQHVCRHGHSTTTRSTSETNHCLLLSLTRKHTPFAINLRRLHPLISPVSHFYTLNGHDHDTPSPPAHCARDPNRLIASSLCYESTVDLRTFDIAV